MAGINPRHLRTNTYINTRVHFASTRVNQDVITVLTPHRPWGMYVWIQQSKVRYTSNSRGDQINTHIHSMTFIKYIIHTTLNETTNQNNKKISLTHTDKSIIQKINLLFLSTPHTLNQKTILHIDSKNTQEKLDTIAIDSIKKQKKNLSLSKSLFKHSSAIPSQNPATSIAYSLQAILMLSSVVVFVVVVVHHHH